MLMHHLINCVPTCIALLVVAVMLAEHERVGAVTALGEKKVGIVDFRGLSASIIDGGINKHDPSKLRVKAKQKDDDADGSATEDADTDEEKPDGTPPKNGKKRKDGGKWGKRFKRLFGQLPRWVRYSVLVGCGVALLAILIGITKCYKKYRY